MPEISNKSYLHINEWYNDKQWRLNWQIFNIGTFLPIRPLPVLIKLITLCFMNVNCFSSILSYFSLLNNQASSLIHITYALDHLYTLYREYINTLAIELAILMIYILSSHFGENTCICHIYIGSMSVTKSPLSYLPDFDPSVCCTYYKEALQKGSAITKCCFH